MPLYSTSRPGGFARGGPKCGRVEIDVEPARAVSHQCTLLRRAAADRAAGGQLQECAAVERYRHVLDSPATGRITSDHVRCAPVARLPPKASDIAARSEAIATVATRPKLDGQRKPMRVW